MFRSCQIINRELCSLLKLRYSIHNFKIFQKCFMWTYMCIHWLINWSNFPIAMSWCSVVSSPIYMQTVFSWFITSPIFLAEINSLRSCKMFQSTTQNNLRNYSTIHVITDCSAQIVSLKKAVRKRPLFCFSAAPGTLHDDLHMFYWCRRHKFAIKSLLCKTQYFYVLAVICSSVTQNVLLRFHCSNTPHCSVTRTLAIIL